MNRKFLEEFINIFETKPSLWKKNSELYGNKKERLKSLKVLLNKYREVDPNATIEVVRKKVNNIRTTYRKELLKVLKSEKSGSGEDDIYIPSLWYFEKLQFLRDQEEQTMENLEIKNNNHNNSKLAKRKRNTDAEDSFLKQATEYLANACNESIKDEAQVFAEGWAIMYRNMDVKQQLYAKKLMDAVLINGRLGQLSPLSSINLGGQAVYAQGINNVTQPQYLANLPLQIEQTPSNNTSSPSSIKPLKQVKV